MCNVTQHCDSYMECFRTDRRQPHVSTMCRHMRGIAFTAQWMGRGFRGILRCLSNCTSGGYVLCGMVPRRCIHVVVARVEAMHYMEWFPGVVVVVPLEGMQCVERSPHVVVIIHSGAINCAHGLVMVVKWFMGHSWRSRGLELKSGLV